MRISRFARSLRIPRGLTLLEILLAVTIMALAVIPIYWSISHNTSVGIQTEKMQMADKILQSIKEEMTSMPYRILWERAKTATKDTLGKFVLTDDLYPFTLQKVLEIQKKYKDFQVEGSWMFLNRGDPADTSVCQVDVKVLWTQPGKTYDRTRSFVLVAPK